jgi:hypothetical protein
MDSRFGLGSTLALGPFVIGDARIHAVLSAPAVAHRPVAAPADAFFAGSDYGNLVYGRTGTALETMRRSFGEERFDRAMRAYGDRFALEHPTPADIEAVFREHLGDEAARFFHEAMFDRGWLDHEVVQFACIERKPTEGFVLEGEEWREAKAPAAGGPKVMQTSVRAERRGTLRVPTEVEVEHHDGRLERFPWPADEPFFVRIVESDRCARRVRVDPDARVLVDARRSNDERVLDEARAPFFGATARVLVAALQAIFAWVGS